MTPAVHASVSTSYPWDRWTPEDWYFCNMAANVLEDLPQEMQPADMERAMKFSSEMIYSDMTFGVHQYWTNLSPSSPQMRAMFDNCPEMWGIFPTSLVERQDWRAFICATNFSGMQPTDVTFDFHNACGDKHL